MRRQSQHYVRRHSRSGLAPLELTLSLPILLFVMALMVIVGTAAAWKARAVGTAREAVWRSMWPRTGAVDPNPRNWPSAGSMRIETSRRGALPADPYAAHTVVRGPMLVASTGEAIPVREGLLDMDDFLRLGVSQIQREYPLLRRLGNLELEREHALVGVSWVFHEMGYASNGQRRIPRLYPFDVSGVLPGETQNIERAAQAILSNPDNPILEMLENDPELRQRRPSGLLYQPPYGLGAAPDYYLPENGQLRARLLNPDIVCSFDSETLSRDVVNPLFLAIRGNSGMRSSLSECGVPGRLTRDYIRMYETHVAYIDQLLHSIGMASPPGTVPPPPTITDPPTVAAIASRSGTMYANREVLSNYLDQLHRFEDYLLNLNLE